MEQYLIDAWTDSLDSLATNKHHAVFIYNDSGPFLETIEAPTAEVANEIALSMDEGEDGDLHFLDFLEVYINTKISEINEIIIQLHPEINRKNAMNRFTELKEK
tara:strand:+ start:1063 stop:1374 length:312 start_codon:yes stop_codon:yes gene_type:complete